MGVCSTEQIGRKAAFCDDMDKADVIEMEEFLKGQLQRFYKLSLFDRFRHVENGLDINF